MQRSFLHSGSDDITSIPPSALLKDSKYRDILRPPDNQSTHATQQKESQTKKGLDCSIEALPDYMRELADTIKQGEDKSTDMTTMVADIKCP